MSVDRKEDETSGQTAERSRQLQRPTGWQIPEGDDIRKSVGARVDQKKLLRQKNRSRQRREPNRDLMELPKG